MSNKEKFLIEATKQYGEGGVLTRKQIKEIAIKSCRALNIFGFARVDFFLEKSSNKILLNEINTIPGFTKNSMFPMLWEASGLKIEQLVAKLVDISLDL